MRVIVTLAIDVDPDEWASVYGLAYATPATVRMDVRDYVHNSVSELTGIRESGAEVTLR